MSATHGRNTTVLSIRISQADLMVLSAVAKEMKEPVSTLARSLLLPHYLLRGDGYSSGEGSTLVEEFESRKEWRLGNRETLRVGLGSVRNRILCLRVANSDKALLKMAALKTGAPLSGLLYLCLMGQAKYWYNQLVVTHLHTHQMHDDSGV